MSRLLYVLSIFTFFCLSMLAGNVASDVRNPLVHWALDGNGDDSVGSNDLSIQGGSFENGKYGQALSLNGSGAHALDDNGADYLNGLEAITLAMWIKSNQINTDKGFFICDEPSGNDRYLSFRYDASGSNGGGVNIIKAGVNTDGGKTALESSNGVQTKDWQHVTVVWESGADIKLYINGVQDIPTDVETTVNGKLDGLTKVIIGKGAKDTDGGWDGLIDDVYIYAEVLGVDDIAMVMAGTGRSLDNRGKLTTLWGGIKKQD